MAQNPTSPNYDQQIEDLNTQVANLQNLVNALQNQQSNPSTNIPQTSGSSKTTTIPPVTSVQILGTKVGPRGVAVTIGFNTPQGVLSGQIDHYNIWLKTGIANPTGQSAPFVVAATQTSPCTFTYSAPSGSITGIVGVQTVMKDGQVLAFNLCPTTALTIAPATTTTSNQSLIGVALTANVKTNLGSSFTITTPGTYIFIYALEAASGTSSDVHGFLNKNGIQTGTNFNIFVPTSQIGSNLGFFTVVCAAGDVMQPVVQSDATNTYNFIVQFVIWKQISS